MNIVDDARAAGRTPAARFRLRRGRPLRAALRGAAALAVFACLHCSSSSPVGIGPFVGGVDLGVLFAPPTAAEIAAVRADWAARQTAAVGVVVEHERPFQIFGNEGVLRVVSHVVDGNRHYGAVIVPESDEPLPVLVLLHGGDVGIDVTGGDVIAVALALGPAADEFVWVLPSFRSEPLTVDGQVYLSEGEPSPWDRDVDDAIAFLGAALATTPEADGSRVGVVGISRGGLVALLMAVRDPRVDRVVEIMGPTDFFGEYVQEIAIMALEGVAPDLPGLATLDEEFLQPLRRGEIDEATMRMELVRRSAVLFAAELPPLQVHHGTADPVVEVSQAESLIAAMAAIGRGPPDFEAYLYAGGVHDPFTMPGSIPRAVTFLLTLRTP